MRSSPSFPRLTGQKHGGTRSKFGRYPVSAPQGAPSGKEIVAKSIYANPHKMRKNGIYISVFALLLQKLCHEYGSPLYIEMRGKLAWSGRQNGPGRAILEKLSQIARPFERELTRRDIQVGPEHPGTFLLLRAVTEAFNHQVALIAAGAQRGNDGRKIHVPLA